ncbi:uncharacterized protein LOC134701045 [Mytilus trossulus]|uniref:uncharacterized protein LOC134701045 n=1 Tax=Mytilus trossulus TaxID=6551 RepID=UPI003006B155
MNVMIATKTDEYDLEKFWKIESLATEKIDTTKLEEQIDIQKTYEEKQIRNHDNRYFVTLPWKEDHPTLPTNKAIAQRRTESVVRRLSNEPKLLEKYGEIMAEQEKRGFIEKVDTTNEADEKSKIHYIPHHAVRKDSTTTPIRVVFDCSCKATPESSSLNDCLMTTPPNLNDLVGILLRFRLHQCDVTTDIEKAFLNVGLETQDRDVTRFFWFDTPTDPSTPLSTYRFKSVLFGATSSPFILNSVLQKHLRENRCEYTDTLKNDLYVDNIVAGQLAKRAETHTPKTLDIKSRRIKSKPLATP